MHEQDQDHRLMLAQSVRILIDTDSALLLDSLVLQILEGLKPLTAPDIPAARNLYDLGIKCIPTEEFSLRSSVERLPLSIHTGAKLVWKEAVRASKQLFALNAAERVTSWAGHQAHLLFKDVPCSLDEGPILSSEARRLFTRGRPAYDPLNTPAHDLIGDCYPTEFGVGAVPDYPEAREEQLPQCKVFPTELALTGRQRDAVKKALSLGRRPPSPPDIPALWSNLHFPENLFSSTYYPPSPALFARQGRTDVAETRSEDTQLVISSFLASEWQQSIAVASDELLRETNSSHQGHLDTDTPWDTGIEQLDHPRHYIPFPGEIDVVTPLVLPFDVVDKSHWDLITPDKPHFPRHCHGNSFQETLEALHPLSLLLTTTEQTLPATVDMTGLSNEGAIDPLQYVAAEQLDTGKTFRLFLPALPPPLPMPMALDSPSPLEIFERLFSVSAVFPHWEAFAPLPGLKSLNIDLSSTWLHDTQAGDPLHDDHLLTTTQALELVAVAQIEPSTPPGPDQSTYFIFSDESVNEVSSLETDEEPMYLSLRYETLDCEDSASCSLEIPAEVDASVSAILDDAIEDIRSDTPDWQRFVRAMSPIEDDELPGNFLGLSRESSAIQDWHTELRVGQTEPETSYSDPDFHFDAERSQKGVSYIAAFALASDYDANDSLAKATAQGGMVAVDPVTDSSAFNPDVATEVGSKGRDAETLSVGSSRQGQEDEPSLILSPMAAALQTDQQLTESISEVAPAPTAPKAAAAKRIFDDGGLMEAVFKRARAMGIQPQSRSMSVTKVPMNVLHTQSDERCKLKPLTTIREGLEIASTRIPTPVHRSRPSVPQLYILTTRGLQNFHLTHALATLCSVTFHEIDTPSDTCVDIWLDDRTAVVCFKLTCLPAAMAFEADGRTHKDPALDLKKTLVHHHHERVLLIIEAFNSERRAATMMTPPLERALEDLRDFVEGPASQVRKEVNLNIVSTPEDAAWLIRDEADRLQAAATDSREDGTSPKGCDTWSNRHLWLLRLPPLIVAHLCLLTDTNPMLASLLLAPFPSLHHFLSLSTQARREHFEGIIGLGRINRVNAMLIREARRKEAREAERRRVQEAVPRDVDNAAETAEQFEI